eukprot:GHVU01067113.1.p1 GENE.GHVU01067113.1~~GHVU01067113.1.p1  ORF type:complete len:127 (+),score=14.64 GHVU01067113.1:731-1111(+)
MRFLILDNNSFILLAAHTPSGTAAALRDYVVEVLDVLDSIWRKQLLGATADGCPAMLGCNKGFIVLLRQQYEQALRNVWCVAHRVDLFLERVLCLFEYNGGRFRFVFYLSIRNITERIPRENRKYS